MIGRIHFDTVMDFALAIGVNLEQVMLAWCEEHSVEKGVEQETLLQQILHNDDVSVRDYFLESFLEKLITNKRLVSGDKAVIEILPDGGVDIVINYTTQEVVGMLAPFDPFKDNRFYKR